MGKRKTKYRVKSTGEIVMVYGQYLTITPQKSSGMIDKYEFLNAHGERTGNTQNFSPEELEEI